VICTACFTTDLALCEATGAGTIYSYTTVMRSPDPALFVAPYVVALVQLAEGPRILSNILGAQDGGLACDAPVRLVWEPLPDGRCLPLFALATETGHG
jgi:uncharacterized OB-fold protein